MVNLIVWAFSQSGIKEFKKWDIWTSRAKTVLENGQIIEDWLKLENVEQIEKWASKIVNYILSEQEGEINITMHAMAMSKILLNYPEVLINALKNQRDKLSEIYNNGTKEEILKNRIKINALLISFNQKASEDNLEWSHTFYPVRDIKNDIENSLITCDADRKKIIDLEIFDSPSSKILWFTFLWVVGQFIEFLESDKNHPISLKIREKLKIFLWNDYDKLIEFLNKYPFSWKLKEWQLSMRELWEKGELDAIMNKLASDINFWKLSYISWIISDLYLELAMKDLRENKEEILNMDGNRFLLNWNRIKNIYDSNINKLDLLEAKIENNNPDLNPETVWIFTISHRSNDWKTIECKFNPKEENFDIIWNNEKWWHFWVVPLIVLNWLIYDSWLLSDHDSEYISETRPGSMIYLWNEILISREDDTIIVSNKNNKNEIFSTIKIQKTNDFDEIIIDKWLLLSKDYNEYDETCLPHWNKWIDTFSNDTLLDAPFWFNIDSKALIIESIWIKLARNYFLNPNDKSINSLNKLFPKLKNLSKIKWVFSKVTSKFHKNFEEKIKNNKFDIFIVNAKARAGFVIFDVCITIWSEIISEHSLTIY